MLPQPSPARSEATGQTLQRCVLPSSALTSAESIELVELSERACHRHRRRLLSSIEGRASEQTCLRQRACRSGGTNGPDSRGTDSANSDELANDNIVHVRTI